MTSVYLSPNTVNIRPSKHYIFTILLLCLYLVSPTIYFRQFQYHFNNDNLPALIHIFPPFSQRIFVKYSSFSRVMALSTAMRQLYCEQKALSSPHRACSPPNREHEKALLTFRICFALQYFEQLQNLFQPVSKRDGESGKNSLAKKNPKAGK